MKESINVTLPNKIKTALDRVTKEEGISRSDVVRKALSDYLFMRQFRKLRSKLGRKAQGKGIYTDEDVFERVS